MKELYTKILEVNDTHSSLMDTLFIIYSKYYDNTSYKLFIEDFKEKDRVIILFNQYNIPVGFTTLKFIDFIYENKPHKAIFSGDTIIEPDYWGNQHMAFAWIRFVGQYKKTISNIPLYWFLIVKGHRTYRYLNAFTNNYYPHCHNKNEHLKKIVDYLANMRYGKNYNPNTGIISFNKSKGNMNEIISDIDECDLNKDYVQYFLKRNPGYLNGDEMVCLTELSEDNLKPLPRKIFSR